MQFLRKERLSIYSTCCGEAEQSAMEVQLQVVAFKSFSPFRAGLSASSMLRCVYGVLIRKASCGLDYAWDCDDKTLG